MTSRIHKKVENGKKKRRSITLIETLILLCILTLVGNCIYQLFHWRETLDVMKEIGFPASVAVIAAVFLVKRWIDKL